MIWLPVVTGWATTSGTSPDTPPHAIRLDALPDRDEQLLGADRVGWRLAT